MKFFLKLVGRCCVAALIFIFTASARADSAWPIRLACDQAVRNAIPVDLDTGNSPVFIRGDDLEFQLGILRDGILVTNWTNIASITLAVYAEQNDTNSPMILSNMPVTSANFNTNLTYGNWTNGVDSMSTNQHADFFIPNALSSIPLNGQASQGYWLRIFIETTNSPPMIYTCMDGPITVEDGPISSVSPPAQGYFRFYTVSNNIVPQLYDPVTAHFYNVEIDTVAGIRTLSLGDTPY